jgi:Tol biopolymer transport system component
MALEEVYLSCHRGDEIYEQKVKAIIQDFKFEQLKTIHIVGNREEEVGAKVTNAQISRSIVILLVTEGWYIECQYDLELTLYHDRPFIVVFCKTGVHAPVNYPPKLSRKLNQYNAITLFDDQKNSVETEVAQLKYEIKKLLDDEKRTHSTKRFLPLPDERTGARIGNYWKIVNNIFGVWQTLFKIAITIVGLAIVIQLLSSGGIIQVPSVIPIITATFVPTPFPLPQVSQMPDANGYIAYQVGKNKSWNINLLSLNSGSIVSLTQSNYDNSNPAWSCDGRKLAFTSNQSGYSEIYIWDSANGINSQPERITFTDDIEEGFVEWSPNGKELAYIATPPNESNGEIFTLNLASKKVKQITNNDLNELFPDWSCTPYNLLAFEVGAVYENFGSINLYINDPNAIYENGTGVKITQDTDGRTRYPAWSCDGKYLAYSASPDGTEKAELYVLDADGTHKMRLTSNDYNDFAPSWSPDGKLLVFRSDGRDANDDLYILDLATKLVTYRLTGTRSVDERRPTWQSNADCQ